MKKYPIRKIDGKTYRLQSAGFKTKKQAQLSAKKGKKSGRWDSYRIVKTNKGYQRLVSDKVARDMKRLSKKRK